MNTFCYKKITCLIAFALCLFSAGCSSTYKVSDFASRNKFFDNFNDFAADKNVRVKLINNNLYNSIGAVIENDTLYSLGQAMENCRVIMPWSEINKVEHNGPNYDEGTVILKDGEKFKSKKIKFSSDSIEFYTSLKIPGKKSIAAVDKIKEVRYNDRWGNIGTKVIAGAAAGLVTGFAIGTKMDDNAYYQQQGEYAITGCLFGAPTGALLGLIIGQFTGYNYIYEFTPQASVKHNN